MFWVEHFYSKTGEWWGAAESRIDAEDRWRAAMVAEFVQPGAPVLELGCGYGSTATAMAEVGLDVTAIDISARVEAAMEARLGRYPTFVRGDFYEAHFGSRFEVVCYWDGFGVGTDDDQRRLLQRVADEWLEADGVCLVEVFNPSWWAAQNGFEETKHARPEDGYHFSLGHRRTFDASTKRAEDIWWELGGEEQFTQSLRCYSPTDLSSLVRGILQVSNIRAVGSGASAPTASESPSYLAILRR